MRVETIVIFATHRVTPITVRTIPTIGRKGTNGQMIISTMLKIPPSKMRIRPAVSKIRREKKPTQRETRRSMNIWNLRSSEEPTLADSAEIWRKGLKRVRRSEPIEKKSMMLVRWVRIFWMKTPQPAEYHQKSIFVIAIIIL